MRVTGKRVERIKVRDVPPPSFAGWGLRFLQSVRLRLAGGGGPWLAPSSWPWALSGLGSLISDWRALCAPCEGWKDAAWALTPAVPSEAGVVVSPPPPDICLT